MAQGFGEIVFGVTVGSVLCATLLALGERVRHWMRIPVAPGVRPAVAFALGSWALGSVVLLAGLVGAFRPLPLLILAGLSALAGRWHALPRLARRLLAPGIAALLLLPVGLAPPFFYDSWVYHLGLPWQALQDHALRAHPENLFSTFPPLAQLIYAVPLGAGALRATGWIHLVGYLTGAAAVSSIARRLGAARAASILAGVAVLYLPKVMLIPAFPAAEAWSFAAITASIALAFTGRPARGAAAGSGLVAGVACAARLQGLSWALLAGLVVLRRAPRSIALFGLAVVGGAAPWWLKNAVLLGDPFAPIGWHRAGIETLWRDSVSNLNLAAGPGDLLGRVAGSLGATASVVLPLLGVGLVAFFSDRRRAKLVLIGIAAAAWLAWSLTGALDRFLAPALGILVAVAASVGRRGVGRAIAIATLSAVLAWGAWSGLRLWTQIGGLALLAEAPAVYAATVVSDPSPAYRACAGLPQDARLLLVSEPRGFLLPRAFETTSQHDPSPLAALLERDAPVTDAARALRELGFTHLLVSFPELTRLGAAYPVLPWSSAQGRARFVELTNLLGKPVVVEDDVVVYALGD